MHTPRWLILVLLVALASLAPAEQIRIATYNIENWSQRFDTRELAAWAKKQPESEELNRLIRAERNQDDEDNWEIAQTLLNPEVNADIVLFQEGADQADVEYFNKKWLKGAYQTIIVFPSNTGRHQHVGVMLKEGFEVLEKRDQYHLEKDAVAKDFLKPDPGETPSDAAKENRLFARGPSFVKVKSPGGYVFWVGTNHQKSKGGNSVEVTAWRLREAKRTHEIITELAKDGTDVIFGGDMNDELGIQEFETDAGGDVTAALAGSDGKLILATRELDEKGAISYGGYENEMYRSLIDHIVVSAALKDRIESVTVFQRDLASAASDHYPVILNIKSPEPARQSP